MPKKKRSFLSRIPVIGIPFEIMAKINAPAPYDEFGDYDAYWKLRSDKAGRVLHRYEVIAERLSKGSRVLDIGCGDGDFILYLSKVRPDVEAIGVDVSEVAVERGVSRGVDCRVIDPAEPLSSQVEGEFDYIVLMEVLEHIVNAEEVVRQAMTLEPDRIFITIPNMGYFMHRLRLMFGGRTPTTFILYHMKEHVRFWTVKDFLQWADVMGLDVCDYLGQMRSLRRGMGGLVRWWPSLFATQMIYELKILR